MNWFLTPLPQMVHALLLPPFAILALWTLQYFPMRLLPHTSVVPNNNHSQLFVPLVLTIVYILKMFFSLNTDILLRSNPRWGARQGGGAGPLSGQSSPSCECVGQACLVYMKNYLSSACTKKVFFVHAELG